MPHSLIPNWTSSGLLPPIRSLDGTSPDRAPYIVTLRSLIDRFATSPERISILQGFLNFRVALHECGINKGFQWLNGSFMTHVEVIDSRNPNDIDVVTFFFLPPKMTQKSLMQSHSNLFSPTETKGIYRVDSYPFILNTSLQPRHVNEIAYWYSMWSHTKETNLWKGFLQVNLAPDEESIAKQLLEQKNKEVTHES